MSDLLWSMSLVNWRKVGPLGQSNDGWPVPPALYSALKLCFPPVGKKLPDDIRKVPAVPAIHRHAANGAGNLASELAFRRLRASGYSPIVKSLLPNDEYAKRTAAALLVPVSDNTLEALFRHITRSKKENAKLPATQAQ